MWLKKWLKITGSGWKWLKVAESGWKVLIDIYWISMDIHGFIGLFKL